MKKTKKSTKFVLDEKNLTKNEKNLKIFDIIGLDSLIRLAENENNPPALKRSCSGSPRNNGK